MHPATWGSASDWQSGISQAGLLVPLMAKQFGSALETSSCNELGTFRCGRPSNYGDKQEIRVIRLGVLTGVDPKAD